jgi:hypothetical protein
MAMPVTKLDTWSGERPSRPWLMSAIARCSFILLTRSSRVFALRKYALKRSPFSSKL